MMKFLKRFAIGTAVIAVAIAIWVSTLEKPADPMAPSVETVKQSEPAKKASIWATAGGNIWTGVILYYGPQKMIIGEILGGSDGEVSINGTRFKGVLIRMKDGKDEWKQRTAIVTGPWYVRTDDPALKGMEWKLFRTK